MNDKLKIVFRKPDKKLYEYTSNNTVINSFSDWDNIPNPKPAKKEIADWYKQQSSYDTKTGMVKTIKKCVPFLDALTAGYTINFCSEIDIEVKGKGVVIDGPGKIFCGHHPPLQYNESPIKDNIALKFSSPWVIETPPGWSCLFVHPLNSFNKDFEILAGIVDTDTYRLPVNFPFYVKGDRKFKLTQDTPMVQVIPFCRQEFKHEVSTINYNEWLEHQQAIGDNWSNDGYKDNFHQKKKYD